MLCLLEVVFQLFFSLSWGFWPMRLLILATRLCPVKEGDKTIKKVLHKEGETLKRNISMQISSPVHIV